ncbi:MAG: dihydropteroate synthase [Planctomycetaceae bacterium]|nr:dihydropteroate synthase [Planctomycetaceae bacterium]
MASILIVTGKLAEASVRRVLAEASPGLNVQFDVRVLPITVAALMHSEWVRRKLTIEKAYDRVVLPGWCQGDIRILEAEFGVPFELGPKDVRDLPTYLGKGPRAAPDLSAYDIEIIAEINHAPRMSDADILAEACHYRDSGADIIDLGCIPGEAWSRIGDVTRLLRAEGLRVSVDSFERAEVESAVAAGAELVLSVNSTNLAWAAPLEVEFVAIPDLPHEFETLATTIEQLEARGRRFRIDPIIEPVGMGFAASLWRYNEARRRWPHLPMMMGIGNITELLEVDSAGVNLLLAAVCQELAVGSVLTTEVINWASSSVREFDLARRVIKYAFDERVIPKHLDSRLVMLRDARVREFGDAELRALAAQLADPNFRIFVERGEIHVMNRDGYWHGTDPFELFDRFSADAGLDASHAFYLGYELAKAVTALTLSKQYTQDQPLQWGFLTRAEPSAHERRRQQATGRIQDSGLGSQG